MECIIPLTVEGVAGEVDGRHLGGIGFFTRLVGGFVALGFHFQSSVRGGSGDQFHDHFVTDQRLASPILRDVAEKPMLDLVPFAGGWGKMTHADFQSEFAAQLRQTPFP